jgi:trk system potassium uptake protein
LRRGVAEALEIVARGDRKSSKVVGRKVVDLKLPADVHIGLIIRGLHNDEGGVSEDRDREPQVIIPRSHTVVESGDHVVFFLPNKRLVQEVERLFRVSATFF